METRANYVLIGAFTLAGLLGMLGFFLWFARVELDKQFAYYDVAFSSVSGLSNASDVRFAGLPVGQVADVRLAPERDGTILVRLEVDAQTPVRIDSMATIESQGVTGVSYVGIDAGTPTSPLLEPETPGQVPRIEAGRSALQSLTEDGPELVAEALRVVRSIGNIVGGENEGRFENILINVEAASEDFSSTLESFSDVTGSVAGFADQVDRFNTTLESLSGELSVVLATADTTLTSVAEVAEQGKGFLTDGSNALRAAEQTITSAQGFVGNDLPALSEEFRMTVEDLRRQIATLTEDARRTLEIFNDTGMTATARLVEAEDVLQETSVMIDQLERTLDEMYAAAVSFDDLVTTDGSALIIETRAMIDGASKAIDAITRTTQNDLPDIIANIRAATDSASLAIEKVGSDLSAASGKIDGLATSAKTTLDTVTGTFANANETLGAINQALDIGEGALSAAERAFNGADKVLNEDIATITADLRESIGKLNGVVDQVSEDIPAVSRDLRAASNSAQSLFRQLEGVVATSGPAVNSFATDGLPLYSRLAQETRTLIDNLDRLTNQISRDPARFFLNQQTPEFRR
jgi:phospholipid/cholesterol/gamma-HCH transport system substrate-binding protein